MKKLLAFSISIVAIIMLLVVHCGNTATIQEMQNAESCKITDSFYFEQDAQGLPTDAWISVYYYIGSPFSYVAPVGLREYPSSNTIKSWKNPAKQPVTKYWWCYFLVWQENSIYYARWINLPRPLSELRDFNQNGRIDQQDLVTFIQIGKVTSTLSRWLGLTKYSLTVAAPPKSGDMPIVTDFGRIKSVNPSTKATTWSALKTKGDLK